MKNMKNVAAQIVHDVFASVEGRPANVAGTGRLATAADPQRELDDLSSLIGKNIKSYLDELHGNVIENQKLHKEATKAWKAADYDYFVDAEVIREKDLLRWADLVDEVRT